MPLQRISASTGAAGSIAFVLWTGRRNPSVLLIGLFVLWVASPFIGLICARASRGLAMAVSLSSLALYGYIALSPPRPQIAKWFLVTPLASWLLILAAHLLIRHSPNRRKRA